MLNNEVVNNELFNELLPIAESMNLFIVGVEKTIHNSETHIAITISSKVGDTGIDDCERFHRTIMPRLELKFGRDNLSIEVSTPGLQRAFKDVYEFSVFRGRRVRVYNLSLSAYVTGEISDSDPNMVVLKDVLNENDNSRMESMKINFNDIQKAKLEFCYSEKGERK